DIVDRRTCFVQDLLGLEVNLRHHGPESLELLRWQESEQEVALRIKVPSQLVSTDAPPHPRRPLLDASAGDDEPVGFRGNPACLGGDLPRMLDQIAGFAHGSSKDGWVRSCGAALSGSSI